MVMLIKDMQILIWTELMNEFERIIEIHPAWDKRNQDPNKNYGIHGVELVMVLKGEKGAIDFVLYTNWMPPHIYEEWKRKMNSDDYLKTMELMAEPFPADLGYHSYEPLYEGQSSSGNCKYLDDKPCYYDGSGLNAKKVYDIMLQGGSDAVWKYLEEYYYETFCDNMGRVEE